MFDRLPNRIELGVFAVMALICAVVVGIIPKHDYAMMFAVMPLFAVSAVMGFCRNERLRVREIEEGQSVRLSSNHADEASHGE